MRTDTALSRREATLRSAATACLAGIALVQAIGLPSLLAQGRGLAVLSFGAMALCVGLGWALAAAPAGATRRLWRVVVATAALMIAGWAAPRAFPVPGLVDAGGHWTTLPVAALSALCLLLAGAAAPSMRTAARDLATAARMVFVMVGPLVAALTLGKVRGDEAAAGAVGGHAAHVRFENTIRFVPGTGRAGGHFVVPVATAPHPTVLGVALATTAALIFTYGAVGCLRRRSAPSTPVTLPRVEGALA